MTSLLLVVIYMAFISLGLPDSLLGAAWPSMYQELGADVSWAGGISMLIAGGTIISSLASDRLTKRFGAGLVTAVSVCMTAVALFGFSISTSFWMLCLWAIPYGLGAGSVDAALNNFVALHYSARHMSWLHCMWGVGASIGPMIMGWAIGSGIFWKGGYGIIALLQIVLTVLLLISLPLWKKKEYCRHENKDGEEEKSEKSIKLMELIQRDGVKEVLTCFFCYCALEATAGMWAASYCTISRGILAEEAAKWASLFYLGITAGRFVGGFITIKLNDRRMIRLGQMTIGIGLCLMLLPFGKTLLFIGLIMVGCGCAPIYPSIIHETPLNFGRDLSQAMIGIQMAFAYIGTCLVPPIFGIVAQYVDISWYPVFLILILIVMIIMSEKLHNIVDNKKRGK